MSVNPTINAILAAEPTGTIVAAIIAGTFSYFALIISKEQKVSDHRQAWVDALRAEVSEFLTSVRLIHHGFATQASAQSSPQDFGKHYTNLLSSYNRIILRLNPKNESHNRLLESLTRVRDSMSNGEYDSASSELDRIRDKSRLILKQEWERIKAGERFFRLSKVTLAILLTASAIAYIYLPLRNRGSDTPSLYNKIQGNTLPPSPHKNSPVP